MWQKLIMVEEVPGIIVQDIYYLLRSKKVFDAKPQNREGHSKTVRYWVEAGALRIVDARDRYFSDNKVLSSGLN